MGDCLVSAAKCYNERGRCRQNVPCDSTDGTPSAIRFVTASDRCPECEGFDDKDFEDQVDHYCTIEHITQAFGVDEVELLKVARRLRGLDVLERLG